MRRAMEGGNEGCFLGRTCCTGAEDRGFDGRESEDGSPYRRGSPLQGTTQDEEREGKVTIGERHGSCSVRGRAGFEYIRVRFRNGCGDDNRADGYGKSVGQGDSGDGSTQDVSKRGEGIPSSLQRSNALR